MNTEENPSLEQRASLYGALADPARLSIVDMLVLGDASPSELQRRLSISSNLLAHHIGVLERAGLVHRSRSEGDKRRTYLRLEPAALDVLVSPSSRVTATRIVFVCTHNSARSQLAAALWNKQSCIPAASAGTHPAPRIHSGALATARRHALPLETSRPAAVEDVLAPGDMVIAVCDNAHEEMRENPNSLHWSIPDPARAGSAAAFDRAFDDIDHRVARLAPHCLPNGELS
ncbi:MAG: helix-turn-helix domain-containing protein [Rhodococcus sp.]|uniref:arsenate reductase/protein-tyrosine-phosphatase family protein n=1 Tax=Rhodococcus sp. MEB032 TaxID=3040322 RepID=UPI002298305B|nr:helix-turn-helix domain-containing protein [Rhodococcus sp. MEB032]MCY4666718.1 helix-turn-helix domain-containing protein [Rhodococcus sp. (in: high G+C Gram-positive bacteria)]